MELWGENRSSLEQFRAVESKKMVPLWSQETGFVLRQLAADSTRPGRLTMGRHARKPACLRADSEPVHSGVSRLARQGANRCRVELPQPPG